MTSHVIHVYNLSHFTSELFTKIGYCAGLFLFHVFLIAFILPFYEICSYDSVGMYRDGTHKLNFQTHTPSHFMLPTMLHKLFSILYCTFLDFKLYYSKMTLVMTMNHT